MLNAFDCSLVGNIQIEVSFHVDVSALVGS